MGKSVTVPAIRLRGVRHNNLKNFGLDLPLNRLVVITGLSGSGKSSLAFDTLFAEGQRRYIETFSPYARQFLDRMDKPKVDVIENIPPAIAIEQRNSVRSTRSTVGTLTEICDYMKSLWPHLSQLHCRSCGRPVVKDTSAGAWKDLATAAARDEILVTFDLPLTEKLSLEDSLALVSRQGYRWLLLDSRPVRLEEARERLAGAATLTIIQDRLRPEPAQRARFVEAWDQACHFGKGHVTVWQLEQGAAVNPRRLSNRLHCAECDIEYRPPSNALFSFNHPNGACPKCRGFGRVIGIDYGRAIPDPTRTLAEGLVKPWQTGQSAECQQDLMRVCRELEIPTRVPFNELPEKWQRFVVDGDAEYGKDEEHEWPRAWYGVKGYFRWLESKAYKMHVRVLLSRYRSYTRCPDCRGTRFQPEALLYRANDLTLPAFYALPVTEALAFIAKQAGQPRFGPREPLGLVLEEVRSRLAYLEQVGLGYLTLDRPTRSLSGGETERVHLTTCLGTRLVNTLFVLDEPSVGLHPRDTARLVRILESLRNAGNTVVVVEHEASVMRAADHIVDLGPGHGTAGGHIVFQGSYDEIIRSPDSLTGQFLSGRKRVSVPGATPTAPDARPVLRLTNASRHNLQNLSVDIPLGLLVSVTGVSGSGKSTLVKEILLPLLTSQLDRGRPEVETKASDRLDSEDSGDDSGEEEPTTANARLQGADQLGRVLFVDQSLIGKSPRSNPAVYIGAFNHLREFFAQSEAAKSKGYTSAHFSFNAAAGQCERCRGAGYEKIEMQFLSDVFIRCPECDGRRYQRRVLEVRVPHPEAGRRTALSIADFLDGTVEDAISFLTAYPDSRHARNALRQLQLLADVGLGYLTLGQPINTLSGGESQRLKLVRGLADLAETESAPGKPTLFLFDEPTTGLHFADVEVLLKVFRRLVNEGHSVLVIEHNLDVIRSSDWVIDLGPDAGQGGGRLVAAGTPAQVMDIQASHTGRALRGAFDPPRRRNKLLSQPVKTC